MCEMSLSLVAETDRFGWGWKGVGPTLDLKEPGRQCPGTVIWVAAASRPAFTLLVSL